MILFIGQYYIPIPSFLVPFLPPNPGMGDGHHKRSLAIVFSSSSNPLFSLHSSHSGPHSQPWPPSGGSHLVLCCRFVPPETKSKLSFSHYLPFANFSVIIHSTHLHTSLLSALTSVWRIPSGPVLSVCSSWNKIKAIF